jgi:putative SOS response-associated peptidase YedK
MLTSAPEILQKQFGYVERRDIPPRYNIAPGQPVEIVRLVRGKREFVPVRWGLIPSWVKDPREFSLLINARIESVLDKPSFKNAIRRRRCLVPADGFYEWQKAASRKRPFVIRPRAGDPVAFAGIWETWADRDGGEIGTMAIITCPANKTLAKVHDRMPAIVRPEHFDAWLDVEKVDAETALALIGTVPEDFFEAFEVSTRVNKAENEGPELIKPLDGLKGLYRD